MLSRFFPESIFPRRLSATAERRLRLARARAEEAVIRVHVDNALMFVDTLIEEASFDRAIDTYIRVMGVPEPLASMVATRALVALGEDLVPYRKHREFERAPDDEMRPALRISDAAEAPQRTVRRA